MRENYMTSSLTKPIFFRITNSNPLYLLGINFAVPLMKVFCSFSLGLSRALRGLFMGFLLDLLRDMRRRDKDALPFHCHRPTEWRSCLSFSHGSCDVQHRPLHHKSYGLACVSFDRRQPLGQAGVFCGDIFNWWCQCVLCMGLLSPIGSWAGEYFNKPEWATPSAPTKLTF